MDVRWLGLAVMAMALNLSVGMAGAQTRTAGAPAPASAVSSASRRVCVNAEIDGIRALSYDCLSQQLAPASAVSAYSRGNEAEGLATGPSNRTGTFNASAEHNRFGTNWGKSVMPQRPPPLPAVPLR